MSEPLSIALVGFGGHVRKNLLRLFALPGAPRLSAVLVRDVAAYRAAWPDHAALFTSDFDALLADPGIDVVYVATPIAAHALFAARALAAGKHVWCEKPVSPALETTRDLADLAAARGVMLGEVAMYRHHAQFAAVQGLLADKAAAGVRLVAARARFTIPELPPGDIRYDKAAGGGALLDVGYYPLSLAGALFGLPRGVAASGYTCPERGVDLSGSAALDYWDFAVHALWAIGAAYASELELSFADSTVLVPRAFAKPPDLAVPLSVIQANGASCDPIAVAADDQFANLFAHYTTLIRADDHAAFSRLGAEAVQAATPIEQVRSALDGAGR